MKHKFFYNIVQNMLMQICNFDGKFLQYVDSDNITMELLNICLNNKNNRNFSLEQVIQSEGIRKSKKAMDYLCRIDGNMLMYADPSIIDNYLIDTALKNNFNLENVKECDNLKNNLYFMNEVCMKDGNLIQYADSSIINSDLLYNISLTNSFNYDQLDEETKKKIEDVIISNIKKDIYSATSLKSYFLTDRVLDEIFSNPKFEDRYFVDNFIKKNVENFVSIEDSLEYNEKFLKRLCKIDGNYIDKAFSRIVDMEMLNIAKNSKKPFDGDFTTFKYSKDVMMYYCKLDGNNIQYANSDIIDEEMIRVAMSNPDKSKCLTLDAAKTFQNVCSNSLACSYLCDIDISFADYAKAPLKENIIEKLIDRDDFTNKDFKVYGKITDRELAYKYINKRILCSLSEISSTLYDEDLINYYGKWHNLDLYNNMVIEKSFSKDFVKFLCGLDGRLLEDVDSSLIDEELIKIADSYSLKNHFKKYEQLKNSIGLRESKVAMKYFCEINGEFIRYAFTGDNLYSYGDELTKRMSTIGNINLPDRIVANCVDDELLNIALNNIRFGFYELKWFLKRYIDSKEKAYKLCKINYEVIECCKPEFIDIDLIKMVLDDAFKQDPTYKISHPYFLEDMDKEFVIQLLKIDGRYLTYVDEKLVDEELCKIAITNENKDRCFDPHELEMYSNVYRNKDAMKLFCNIDGSLYSRFSEDLIDEEILKIIVLGDNPVSSFKKYDSNASYDYDSSYMKRLINNFHNIKDKELVKKLCLIDGNFLNIADSSIIDEELFKIALTGHSISSLNYTPSRYSRYFDNIDFMKIFCKIDGKYLKEASSDCKIDFELLDIATNHEDPNLNFNLELLAKENSYYPILDNYNVIDYFCRLDGNNIKYFKRKLDVNILKIALNNPDPEKRLNIGDIKFNEYICHNSEIMKYLCGLDGRLFKYASLDIVDNKLFEIAVNNPDSEKSFDVYTQLPDSNAVKNIDFMKYICKKDGSLLKYAPIIDNELLEIALNNSDPNKSFKLNNLNDCRFLNNLNSVIVLSRINPYYLLYFSPESKYFSQHDYKRLISYVITNYDYETRKKILLSLNIETSLFSPKELLKQDPLVLVCFTWDNGYEVIEENFKDERLLNDPDISEALIRKSCDFCYYYKRELYDSFINNVCKKYNINKDFFIYHYERTNKINTDFIKTINFEFLQDRFRPIYEADGFEKLYVLGSYPEVQNDIISFSKPLGLDGKIDYSLGDKKIKLFSKMLNSLLKDESLTINDWIPYFSSLLYTFKNYRFYDVLLRDGELTDEEIHKLAVYSLGKHFYTNSIYSKNDLNNFDTIKQNYINKVLESSDDINKIYDAYFEKKYGLSYLKIREMYEPYISAIKTSPELFGQNIIAFYNEIDKVINEKDINKLKQMVKNTESKQIDIKELIVLKSTIKKTIIDDMNKQLFNYKGDSLNNIEPDSISNDVPIYLAAGKNGDKDFALAIYSRGAYSYTNNFFSYKEDWNMPSVASHGICTSIIGNQNLGTAIIRDVVYGFNNYEDNSLLLGGNFDIVSKHANLWFDTSQAELGYNVAHASKYYSTANVIAFTRHTHNEYVFERRLKDNKKRQPSYIVYFCDEYDENVKNDQIFANSVSAAKDFGVPIVVVERKKIAISEVEKINKNLEDFLNLSEDELTPSTIKKSIYDILVRFESNYAGNRSYHNNIAVDYFSFDRFMNLADKMFDKVLSLNSPIISELFIIELNNFLSLEKNNYNYTEDKYDRISGIRNYILDRTSKLNKTLSSDDNKYFNPKYIDKFLDGKIGDNDYLSDYNLFKDNKPYINQIDSLQLNQSDIKDIMDDELKNKLYLNIGELYSKNIYDSSLELHSTRHIEDVMTFSMLIGKSIGLNEEDLDLLLEAAKYHDSGRDNDERSNNHGLSGAISARNYLKDKYTEQEINIIMAAIEYHAIRDDDVLFSRICLKYGIDKNDNELFNKTKLIADCLKDADALDRTRFYYAGNSIVNPSRLRIECSKKLIKVAEQINEEYAFNDYQLILSEHPDYSAILNSQLDLAKSYKVVVGMYRKKLIDFNEKTEEIISNNSYK